MTQSRLKQPCARFSEIFTIDNASVHLGYSPYKSTRLLHVTATNNPESSPQKGISRIDSGSTHGWFVRGYRFGKTHSRLFSDKKWGGREKSLAAANAFREELLSKLAQLPHQPRARRLVFRDSRNTTGVLGVCRTVKRGPGNVLNECYSVSWRPSPGVQKCTSFSIRKYGEEKAFKLAVRHRRKMLKQIYGATVLREVRQRLRTAAPVRGAAAQDGSPASAATEQMEATS